MQLLRLAMVESLELCAKIYVSFSLYGPIFYDCDLKYNFFKLHLLIFESNYRKLARKEPGRGAPEVASTARLRRAGQRQEQGGRSSSRDAWMAAARCRRANKGRLMRSAAGKTRSAAAKREGMSRKWEGWGCCEARWRASATLTATPRQVWRCWQWLCTISLWRALLWTGGQAAVMIRMTGSDLLLGRGGIASCCRQGQTAYSWPGTVVQDPV